MMEIETVTLRDVDGRLRYIPATEIYCWIGSGDFRLFGISKRDILELRCKWLKAGGTFPIDETQQERPIK